VASALMATHFCSMRWSDRVTNLSILELANRLSFGSRGGFPLVEYIFHLAQEFRRKEWLFQNVCAVFTQFGELILKSRYKQEPRFGAICTNSP